MGIRDFVDQNYLHFNAGVVRNAAKSLTRFLQGGGKIFLTLAGAMSTAQLGRSLVPMIEAGHIAGISCTGANMEEDLFLLTAKSSYVKIEDWRNLSAEEDKQLLERKLNRVTDICIPEEEAIREIEKHITPLWAEANNSNRQELPHQYFYDILLSGKMKFDGEIENSWLMSAAKNNIPLFVPGWEDSTIGNIFASHCMESKLNPNIVKSGIHYMMELAELYQNKTAQFAFFQIGGGIAGDFPICVVPMLNQDLGRESPLWSWYCQISESSPSYGGYSGAPPNEKISWGKLSPETPKFVIESDATIVAPLIFAYVLD